MRAIALAAIRLYQRTLSPLLGATCRYEPSCSRYTYTAIERYGAFRGAWMGARRLWRCRPGVAGGFDPVPELPGGPAVADVSRETVPGATVTAAKRDS